MLTTRIYNYVPGGFGEKNKKEKRRRLATDVSTGVSFFKKKEKKTVREALEESVEMLLQDGGKGTPSMVMKSLLAVTWKTETASSEPMNLAKEIFRQNLESVF